jgi:alpha-beta hydrolase superfamily lysophospholipase
MTSPSAEELAKLGFAAYCFDFKGCSYSNKSGGDIRQASVLTEKAELEAALDWFSSLPFIDRNRVYLLGQSMGGVVSMLAGAEVQEKIAGMLLMYPAVNICDVVRTLYPDRKAIPELTENYLGAPGLNLGKQFFIDAMDAPLEKAVKTFTKPVYIIHGTADKLVPIACGEKLAADYRHATFIAVPGAEHGFNLNSEQAAEAAGYLL